MTPHLDVNQTLIELVQGDITQQTTDAIVNAANSALAGGGGVDGAIHRAAGWRQLQAALKQDYPEGCPTGQAVITSGFNLSAQYIIHAVGPRYRAGSDESPRLLASAYQRSLEIAAGHDLRSVAFPAISTGVYGYPLESAAQIALQTAHDFAEQDDTLTLIRFVLFDARAFAAFQAALG